MEMDWPHQSSQLNTTIIYTCPPYTLTWKLNRTVEFDPQFPSSRDYQFDILKDINGP
ncbi:hypothetical protein TCAL_15299 [Tigriopus californicus]|uniref:Uncharacterized protein n=1 Tax=Tigriopus californicus TaxID=6832 RepID=A0A553PKC6_TIGCA|nr:hypothetical protein TCAL_15299 [Tigriopus californicus]